MEKSGSSQTSFWKADDVISIPKQDNIVSIVGLPIMMIIWQQIVENGKSTLLFEGR